MVTEQALSFEKGFSKKRRRMMMYRFHWKKGTRALAVIISFVMVITLLSPAAFIKVKAADPVATGSDVAVLATATANGEHSEWGILASNLNNDHNPSSSGDNAGSWHDYDLDKGSGTSWVQYDWTSNVSINSMSIYWMCDGDWASRIPISAKLEYMDAAGNMQTLATYDAATMAAQVKDQYNQFDFGTEITTKRIRLTMDRNTDGFCSIHRWKVFGKADAATQGTATATSEADGHVAAIMNGSNEPATSDDTNYWSSTVETASVEYNWELNAVTNSMSVYWQKDGVPKDINVEYKDASNNWISVVSGSAVSMGVDKLDQYNLLSFGSDIKTKAIRMTMTTDIGKVCAINRWKVWGQLVEDSDADLTEEVVTKKLTNGYQMKNKYFLVETGEYGQITTLRIQGDKFPTNYVMNEKNAPSQKTTGHEWMGELMFTTKVGDDGVYTEQNTSRSDQVRKVELVGKKVVVTYTGSDAPASDASYKGIKDFKVTETYSIVGDKLQWDINVENTSGNKLIIGDLGLPLAFNEFWSGGGEIYETRTVDHSFVAKQSSYVYATRPSGQGQYLLFTPDASTGAGLEYQDHWRTEERATDEKMWCQDQGGWANGLNVFYIHSDYIKKTNRGYLDNTKLELNAGESKTYTFNFNSVDDETDMKSTLYKEGVIDAVAVPGMTYAVNMPGKLYLHTSIPQSDISVEVKCPHETKINSGHDKTVYTELACKKTAMNTYVKFVETKIINGEQYHIYDIKFADLGQNNVVITYKDKDITTQNCETVLQFYMMDDIATALETHSDFMVDKTQWDTPLKTGDKVFDDWMMDTKNKRGETDSTYWQKNYWGWGDDWGLTHGEYIAEKNVYQPVQREIEAVDEYLDIAIWNGLMREHQKDYLIHDFLQEAPNTSPTYRGYAYPHIYNTYFSMYKIASKYPDMVTYKEDAKTYLLRAYNIFKALYGEGVSYNFGTGLMGELTTPDIIAALEKEGYYTEAANITALMAEKYKSFKDQKYPYGSEYSYDNTGEEAVYTLAKLNQDTDTANANTLMQKIDLKTRACRGLQPVWYQYANPTTICGENWWNFQYSAALIGYCMDDWLRVEDNGWTTDETAAASRVNYAAKLANLTSINSGQIDSDPANIGTIAWTYQSELGNLGAQGTGGGNLHNGWRQMAGEADLGLFGALQILSSDVTIDPVFGLFGYGCEVSDAGTTYKVTPLDGLFTRLNFINQKLYIELDKDQYTDAEVAKDNTSVKLTMKNLEKTAHKTDVNITGLAAGSYQVMVDGTVTGSFQALDGKVSTVTLPLPAVATASVSIIKGTALANKAPTVELAASKTVEISDKTRLEADATDDGYVNQTLTYLWEVKSAPAGGKASITDPDKHITEVTFSSTGDYVFKFSANDGGFTTSKEITVTVKANNAPDKDLANYTFNTGTITGIDKLYAKSNNSFDCAEVDNKTVFVMGKEGNGVKYTGSISGGYIELPEALTKNLNKATISTDVKLTESQSNKTTLFEFGKNMVVEFVNSNELIMTVNGKTVSTGVELASGYWKNIEVTVDGDDYILYLNGEKKAELLDTGLSLASINTETERYLIGRSQEETDPFLKGIVDNFVVKSYVMTASQLKAAYGTSGERTIVSGKAGTIVTMIGTAPVLPAQVSVLYSDGEYEKYSVNWDSVKSSNYAQSCTFTVSGKVTGTNVKVTATVIVVGGTAENVAEKAVPTAIIDTPADLGGVKGLNDGYTPDNSADTSHGVWHNWQGNKTGTAWVQYTWKTTQVVSGVDLYFFKDGGGNFDPSSYTIEYQNESGEWLPVSKVSGLGIELDKFNMTSFAPVATKAIKISMNPAHNGCGVIEWKAYAYKLSDVILSSDDSGSSTGSIGDTQQPVPTSKPVANEQTKEVKTKESPATVQEGKANIKLEIESQELLDSAKTGKVNLQITIPEKQLVEQFANKTVKQVALDIVVPSAVLDNSNIKLSDIVLPKEVLEGAKESGKNIKVSIKNEDGQVEASWTFSGKKLAKSKETITDLNLAIQVGTEKGYGNVQKILDKDKNNNKAVIVDFAYQNSLPENTMVTLNLGDTQLKAGDSAYLYIYNDTKKKYEEVVAPKYTVDKSGLITFEVSQGAQYVLLKKRPDAAVTDRLVDQVIIPEQKTITEGKTLKLSVETPVDVAAKITYKVSDSSLVSIDKNGKITAKADGTVKITTTVIIQGSKKTFVTELVVKRKK